MARQEQGKRAALQIKDSYQYLLCFNTLFIIDLAILEIIQIVITRLITYKYALYDYKACNCN